MNFTRSCTIIRVSCGVLLLACLPVVVLAQISPNEIRNPVLKVTGNYSAAYNTEKLTRNERGARTLRDIILPCLQVITQTIPPDRNFDAIGFEIAYHARGHDKAYDYEGKETLVVVFELKDAFLMSQTTNDQSKQDILNRSL